MEAALMSSAIKIVAPKIFSFLEKKHKLQKGLEEDIRNIGNELKMTAAAIKDHDRPWRTSTEMEKKWIQGVRELAYGIEDSMERYLHLVTPQPGASSLSRKAHKLMTIATRTKFAAEIQQLRKQSDEMLKLREKYTPDQSDEIHDGGQSDASMTTYEKHTPDPVGLDCPLDELLELIREDEGQPKQLKVISIVGFGGLGKTVLARQVFNSATVREQYEPRIWVRASEKGPEAVLEEILKKVDPAGMEADGGGVSCDATLSERLGSKRFFIVIDGMSINYWDTIKNAFPENAAVSSRVMVTMAIQPIANACSGNSGHIYMMRTLEEKHSKQLFFKQTPFNDYEPAEQVWKKCDGLPLALVTTSQLLQSTGELTPTGCANLCRNMGKDIEKEETLERMKHVLQHSYSSLPDHSLKVCLMYLGIFPGGRPVKRKCLIRRWLAEGFVEADNRRSALVVGVDNFKELVNRSIVKPIDMSSSMDAKTCQTHGMMLEFILHKSMSEDFITLLYDQERLPDKIRRVSLHPDGVERDRNNATIVLRLVRSLSVFGKADQHVLQFCKYELLRVLDLEECEDLNDGHVKSICNLLLLRYLSLGGGITKLPEEMSKLKFLETLDVRGAKAKIIPIPVQVIKLRHLTHLLGVLKVALPADDEEMSMLQSFLSEDSNLETLAGFVADQSPEFPGLMGHMNSLTKVKVWCKLGEDGGDSPAQLSSPIQEFIQRGSNVNNARSLSVNFEGCSQDFLDFTLKPKYSFYINSLKLHGELRRIPRFVTDLGGITELCLSSSGLLRANVLDSLSNVRALHYLKLIADQLDKFVIEPGALRHLRRLCIVAQCVSSLENQEGALLQLESLSLLCKGLQGLCGITVNNLKRLKEVFLDDAVSAETTTDWKEAAKKHPRRPRVSLLRVKEVDQKNHTAMMGDHPSEDSTTPIDDIATIISKMDIDSPAVAPEVAAIQRQVKRKPTGIIDSLFRYKKKANGKAF